MRAADKLKEYEGLSARRDLLDRPSSRVFFRRSVKKSLLNGALPSREMAQVKAPTDPRVYTGRNIVGNCVPRELTGPYFIARAKVTVDFSCNRR